MAGHVTLRSPPSETSKPRSGKQANRHVEASPNETCRSLTILEFARFPPPKFEESTIPQTSLCFPGRNQTCARWIWK
jgi:hypothetical protein